MSSGPVLPAFDIMQMRPGNAERGIMIVPWHLLADLRGLLEDHLSRAWSTESSMHSNNRP